MSFVYDVMKQRVKGLMWSINMSLPMSLLLYTYTYILNWIISNNIMGPRKPSVVSIF